VVNAGVPVHFKHLVEASPEIQGDTYTVKLLKSSISLSKGDPPTAKGEHPVDQEN